MRGTSLIIRQKVYWNTYKSLQNTAVFDLSFWKIEFVTPIFFSYSAFRIFSQFSFDLKKIDFWSDWAQIFRRDSQCHSPALNFFFGRINLKITAEFRFLVRFYGNVPCTTRFLQYSFDYNTLVSRSIFLKFSGKLPVPSSYPNLLFVWLCLVLGQNGVYSSLFRGKASGDTQKRGKPEMRSSRRNSLDLHWSPWPRPGRGSASVPHLRYLSVSRHFNE